MTLDHVLRELVRGVLREELAALQLGATMSRDARADQVQYIDDRELVKRTSISRVTWQVWRTRGKGPPHYRVGRRCLYKWDEVSEWLKRRSIKGSTHERVSPRRDR